jgi:hypothetical protein
VKGIFSPQRFFNSCVIGRFLYLSHGAIEEIARQLRGKRSSLLARLWISEEQDDTTSLRLPTATFLLYAPEERVIAQICCDPFSEQIFSTQRKGSPVHSLEEDGIVWSAFVRPQFEEMLFSLNLVPPAYVTNDHRRFASPAD